MKLPLHEMQPFLDTLTNATDIVRNENGVLLSFSYMKYYGQSKNAAKKIKVSVKSNKELQKQSAAYLPTAEFFDTLCNNIDIATDIKTHCDKIYKFSANGKKYKTDKSNNKKLFDFLPYKDFLKVTRQRFYGIDTTLRNGYFSGLIGTHTGNISYYERNCNDYILYDVDFNAAYPYTLKMPMPCGRFYTADEWAKVADNYNGYLKFYDIKIKSQVNDFGIFFPPPPFVEYADFDFLMQKNNPNMVVSEHRLSLIRQVYGDTSYIINKTYYCATKIYLNLARFAQDMYDKRQAAKDAGNAQAVNDYKIAINSLIGNFGKRDETSKIDRLSLVDNDIIQDVIQMHYTEKEYKQQANYLPLAMVANDITARRLLDLMTDKSVLRLTYNTDGGILAVKPDTRLVTSSKMGRLKAERIYKPRFLSCSMLYNRPVVHDTLTDKCYNSKAITYKKNTDEYIFKEVNHINCRQGFFVKETVYPVVCDPYTPFNFRLSELLLRLQDNKLYKALKKHKEDLFQNLIYEQAYASFERLAYPYDELYNTIRHAPSVVEPLEVEQVKFLEKFFK